MEAAMSFFLFCLAVRGRFLIRKAAAARRSRED
jgi:hypothetical protein